MRRIAASLLAAALVWQSAVAATGTPAAPQAIAGFWRTASGGAIIHFTAENGDFPGRIAWLKKPRYNADDPAALRGQPIRDRHNPDAALRRRTLIGLRIVTNLRYHVSNNNQAEWVDGRIYDTTSGHVYRCYIRLGDATHLKLRGFVGIRAFGHTTTWTRVADPQAAPPTDASPSKDAS